MIKYKVLRDSRTRFVTSVFFMNRLYMGPWLIFSNSPRSLTFKSCSPVSDTPQDLVPRSLISRKAGSAGSDISQDFVPRGIRPHRILFRGVWYTTRLCSVGSDIPQGFVPRGLIPRRTSFRWVLNLSEFCSVGSDIPECLVPRFKQTTQDSVPWGIRPRGTTLAWKVYNSSIYCTERVELCLMCI